MQRGHLTYQWIDLREMLIPGPLFLPNTSHTKPQLSTESIHEGSPFFFAISHDRGKMTTLGEVQDLPRSLDGLSTNHASFPRATVAWNFTLRSTQQKEKLKRLGFFCWRTQTKGLLFSTQSNYTIEYTIQISLEFCRHIHHTHNT